MDFLRKTDSYIARWNQISSRFFTDQALRKGRVEDAGLVNKCLRYADIYADIDVKGMAIFSDTCN